MTSQNSDAIHNKDSAQSPIKSRLTPQALLEVKRLSEPRIHPDGVRVAFTVTEADFEESRYISHLWITEIPAPQSEEDDASPERTPDSATETALQDASNRQSCHEVNRPEPSAHDISEAEASDDPEAESEDFTRQLTFSRDGEHTAAWSPDGRYLAFLSTRPDPTESEDEDSDDDEIQSQIWVLPIDGGEARRITNAKEGILDYDWSPEGDALFYLAHQPRPRAIESVRRTERNHKKIDPFVEHDELMRGQIWRTDLEGGKPKLLHTAGYGVSEFRISPDGRKLCYLSNRTGDVNDYHIADLHLVDLETGSSACIVDREGGKYDLRWRPDGAQITFLSWLDPKLSYSLECLFAVDIPEDLTFPATAGADMPLEVQRLALDLDYDVIDYEWQKETTDLYALASVKTGAEIYRIEANHTETAARIDLPGLESRRDLDVGGEGGQLAWVSESESSFPEVFLRESDGAIHQLTRLNAHIAEQHRIPRQEVVSWSSDDELLIEGVLTYPLDYIEGLQYPLIVDIHGGPKGAAANALRSYSMPSVWSAEGYAVLRPNFRGSQGYGNAFAIANRRDLGGGDYRDIMAGVDWAINAGIADPEKLGVMGGSYGGYMTNWIIGQTQRFKSAISMFGIFHLQTDYSNSELSRWANDYLGAYYWEDPEIYRRLSPGTYLEKIITPTLIIHGEDDNNTFISNSKELYQALRHRGVTTKFVRYPRESHGLDEPNHKLDEIRRCLAWMETYLHKSLAGPEQRYRVGDNVPGMGGNLELRVTGVETPTLVGLPNEDADTTNTQSIFLEVQLTIHNRDSREKLEPVTLRLSDLSIKPSNSEDGESWSVISPTGVPLDLPGGKVLLQGDGIHLVQHQNTETGQLDFAFAAVFRVSRSGQGRLAVADFPEVELNWHSPEDHDKSDPNS